MKRYHNFHIRLIASFVALTAMLQANAQKRLFVFSDPHLLAPALFQNNSSAFQADLANDNKMFDQSSKIMQSMVNTILSERPDAVLIPGDLTKQGAKLSHMNMAAILKQITDAGIKVLVIPGNHDVNNTDAVRYDGNNRYQAATITSSEFAELYNDMGYSNAIARDNTTLSYVAEPITGLRVIAVDDSRCVARDTNTALNANGITMGTRTWICNQIDQARELGKQVIVMMHHNLIEHIDSQSALTGDAQVTQADAVRNQLMQHGAQLVLTGHMHISNITTYHNEARTDSIVEISTGSAIAYPCHYRIINLSPDLGTFSVSTASITQVDGIDNFPAYAEQRMAASARATISSIIYQNWDNIMAQIGEYQSLLGDITLTPESVTDVAYRNMAESVTELNKTLAEGNENEKDGNAIKQHLNTGITNFANELLKDANALVRLVAVPLIVDKFNQLIETPLNSALSDCTNYGTDRANVTDDLHPTLHINPVEIPQEPDTLTGDVTGDMVVDIDDVNAIINCILTSAINTPNDPDMNHDHVIDIDDVNFVISIILNK